MYWAVILFYFYKDGHSYSLCSTERDQVWCLATTDCSSHDKLSNWGWQETTSRSLQARLIAIILFNCCFYFQGTISSSTLLGELGSEPPLPAKLSPTVLSELPHTPPSTSQTYSTNGSSPHAIVCLKVWREDIHCSCPMWSLHLPVSPNMFISFVWDNIIWFSDPLLNPS